MSRTGGRGLAYAPSSLMPVVSRVFLGHGQDPPRSVLPPLGTVTIESGGEDGDLGESERHEPEGSDGRSTEIAQT